MTVNFIYNPIQHHSARSGYDQLIRHLEGRLDVQNLDGDIPRLVPERAMHWLARRAAVEWYDGWSLSLEATAAVRLTARRDQICHILYGENTYRFLGALRGVIHRRGGRIVCTYHQPPAVFEQVVGPKAALRRLDAIVALASNQADYLASFVDQTRIFVVRHGIDTEAFTPQDRSGSDGKGCLFVGQWLRDFDTLAAVIRRVHAADPEVRFTLVTDPGSADAFRGLPNVEAVTGIPEDDLDAAYREADLLVLPLTDSTANNSLLEALASGLPIVTTDVGGVRDYVDESCAVLVAPRDADAMAEAVLELTRDERRRVELGRAARTRALDHDWRKVGATMIDVYRAALAA